ncbi:TetR/AcrR family transcriptional regulator [Nocardioides sp. GXZ039]|uniref:TetR/AcrR family transcriptional regulator n=1 Tax=Nocardioides sp. GXZ039 TaxID=3136018 RepID=UPI0030F3A18F
MTATRYHHGNLRQALADAAVAAARERGPDGLAVRELARSVGVSHNAAYRHFADRDALVGVVADAGLAGLVTAMDRRLGEVTATEPVARARARLTALGTGYVDFALAEPGLFQVLFTAYPDPPDGSDASDPYGMLNAALDDLVAVGYLDPALREGADVTCWSAVHGFAMLCVGGPLRQLPPVVRDQALAAMLASLDRAYGVRAESSRAE